MDSNKKEKFRGVRHIRRIMKLFRVHFIQCRCQFMRVKFNKAIILFLFTVLCLVGCKKNIVERNAIEISVENLKNNQIHKIVKENEIATIIDKINSSKKEFLIFKPDVKLVFTYSNGNKKIVLVKKNMLKIDGISYINNSDEDYLPFNF